MHRKAIAILLLFLVAGCSLGKTEAKPEDVDKAATLFFERLSSADYDRIYRDSAESFKRDNPASNVLETLKKMTELGKPAPPIRTSMTFDHQEGKRVALPTYSVLFDNKRATVVFKFIDEDGQWKLGAYEVRQRSS